MPELAHKPEQAVEKLKVAEPIIMAAIASYQGIYRWQVRTGYQPFGGFPPNIHCLASTTERVTDRDMSTVGELMATTAQQTGLYVSYVNNYGGSQLEYYFFAQPPEGRRRTRKY